MRGTDAARGYRAQHSPGVGGWGLGIGFWGFEVLTGVINVDNWY